MKSDAGSQKGIDPKHLIFPMCILSCSLCSLSHEGAPQASPPKNSCLVTLAVNVISIFLNALGAVLVWQPFRVNLPVVPSKCWVLWIRWNIYNPPLVFFPKGRQSPVSTQLISGGWWTLHMGRGHRALGKQLWVSACGTNLFTILLWTQAQIILLCC